MRIGVTEAGDAGLDLSWITKLKNVDGAILITKNLNDNFIRNVMEHQEKLIVHATCTGHGGTILEPGAPDWKWTLKQMRKLIGAGFPAAKIVLRTDPIVPTPGGIERFKRVVRNRPEEVERVRVSVLDMYPHARERFSKRELAPPYGDKFTALGEMFKAVDDALADLAPIKFEACAEPKLRNAELMGCVSLRDLALLGLATNGEYFTGFQRRECKCIGCKIELLPTKKPCQHGCLYCYWKG